MSDFLGRLTSRGWFMSRTFNSCCCKKKNINDSKFDAHERWTCTSEYDDFLLWWILGQVCVYSQISELFGGSHSPLSKHLRKTHAWENCTYITQHSIHFMLLEKNTALQFILWHIECSVLSSYMKWASDFLGLLARSGRLMSLAFSSCSCKRTQSAVVSHYYNVW